MPWNCRPAGPARVRRALTGKSVALIFEKPSTRTRVSFEVGVVELGGHPVVLRGDEMQLSRGESVEDTARVMSRFVSAIVIRSGSHENVVTLAENATVPVINALTPDVPPLPGTGRPADPEAALRYPERFEARLCR